MQGLDFATLEQLNTPLWVYCIDAHRIFWANPSALEVWESQSLDELSARDFSVDTSDAVDAVLQSYVQELQTGKVLKRWWQITPKNIKKKVHCTFSVLPELKGHQNCLFIEGAYDSSLAPSAMTHQAMAFITFDVAELKVCSANIVFENHFSSQIEHLSDLFAEHKDYQYVINNCKPEADLAFDVLLKTLDGDQWFRMDICFQHDLDDRNIIVSLQNIDQRKRTEIEHQEKARTDALTALGNRIALEQAVDDYRQQELETSFLYMDLDGFKAVNDTYGHSNGDILLKQVAERLIKQVGQNAYRIGGDEFVVLLTDDSCIEDEDVATKLVQEISKPYQLGDNITVHISTSIGIARCSSLAQTSFTELLKKADMAMYQAKKAGRRQAIRYDETLGDAYQEKLRLAQLLPDAIANEELYIDFSPVINKNDKSILFVEANIFWRLENGSCINKGKILELAERIGMVEAIDYWLLKKICQSYQDLSEFYQQPIVCALTLSGKYLSSQSFLRNMKANLEQNNIAVDAIALQFSESSILFEGKPRSDKLQKVRDYGFKIILDGFASGLTCLPFLAQLPVDYLKLDRLYGERMVENSAVLVGLQQIATELSLALVVSEVNELDQLKQLNMLEISWLQGLAAEKLAIDHYSR